MKRLSEASYGIWCWCTFIPLALVALLLAIPTPTLPLRRRIARRSARLFFRMAGIRLTVHGLEKLPEGPCVLVANHASYLDGVIMQAVLPPRFAFVIKREMVSVPLAGTLLKRLGSEFVERHDRHRGAADTRRVLGTAASGQSIAVFPEGTFTAAAGIGAFQAGAFMMAIHNNLPVVPAAIRGARWILPDRRLLPRPGAIEVEILTPLPPESGGDRPSRTRLRDEARAAILSATNEPDLLGD